MFLARASFNRFRTAAKMIEVSVMNWGEVAIGGIVGELYDVPLAVLTKVPGADLQNRPAAPRRCMRDLVNAVFEETRRDYQPLTQLAIVPTLTYGERSVNCNCIVSWRQREGEGLP